jgi:hypothetical protein
MDSSVFVDLCFECYSVSAETLAMAMEDHEQKVKEKA